MCKASPDTEQFFAMSGPRRLAVHSDSISTTLRMPVAWWLKLLQHGFDCIHDSRCLKERKTVKTTERMKWRVSAF
jgi:hypothetical protein